MPTLTKWIEVADGTKSALVGCIENDARFETGHRVYTSRVTSMSEDRKTATTISGTVYELGEEIKLNIEGRLPSVYKAFNALPQKKKS